MTKHTISPMFRREGFTLIELLIVIVVMAILAAILVPTINKIIISADNSQSKAFVQRVARAADAFKGDDISGRYPGQDDVGLLKGTTPEAGPYTGSQIVAARLFDYPDSDIIDAAPKATSKYLEYKSYLLINRTSTGRTIPANSLADDSSTSNALLYFPSRLNVTAPKDCYKWADNSTYVSETGAQTQFTNKCITDPRFGGTVARNAGGVLIIGTGANDTYLESGDDNDDVQSWEID